jgi:hypothetical protein
MSSAILPDGISPGIFDILKTRVDIRLIRARYLLTECYDTRLISRRLEDENGFSSTGSLVA